MVGGIRLAPSAAGFIAFPFAADYYASKHAVIAAAETLHHELAFFRTKIKASVLCPAFVATRIMDSQRNRPEPASLPADKRKYHETFSAMCDLGKPPAEIAEATIQAIREEKFYIFTHEDVMPIVEERFDGILKGVNPHFHDGARTRKLLGLEA